MYRVIAERVDVVAGDNMAPPILLDTLNRQPSIMHFKNVLYQLGPSTYQAWFPSAIFRTNSMVQNVEDMMYQDAAFKRKKNSMQLFAQTSLLSITSRSLAMSVLYRRYFPVRLSLSRALRQAREVQSTLVPCCVRC